MHGQTKLLKEGYRTRDGHLIEWMGRLRESVGPVTVVSRPEPQLLRPLVRVPKGQQPAHNTVSLDLHSWALPNIFDRRRWWLQSSSSYRLPQLDAQTPIVVWNPLVAVSNIWERIVDHPGKLLVDLLDDWSIHFAFNSIRPQVEVAYSKLFQRADIVTANAEGTLSLAHRFGRDDAVLMTNGCDPERFSPQSRADGPITIGYVGKIGKRVDLSLICEAAERLPHLRFVFAGPILDAGYRSRMSAFNNVELLGDVHYEKVPELLQTFDIGWVPHNVGEYEVGGDVLKTYEYRAANLPVLSTPVAGAGGRKLESVYVVPAQDHVTWLESKTDGETRVAREAGAIPTQHTWRSKAEYILERLS